MWDLLARITRRVLPSGLPERAQPTPSQQAEAQALLRALASRYENLQTYRDTGVVKDTNETSTITFETRFRRRSAGEPDFYFDFDTSQGAMHTARGVLWTGGRTTPQHSAQRWWTITPKKIETSELVMGIAAYYGVSGAASGTILSLLDPGVPSATPITKLRDPVILTPRSADPDACDIIEGIWESGLSVSLVTLAVSRASGLLREVIIDAHSKDASTITFDPQAPADLHDEDFVFTPPDSSQHQ